MNTEANTPDWSGDGRRIAFEVSDETHAGIAIVDAVGDEMTDLTPNGFQGQPSFTPDGRIVFDCGTCAGGQGIFIMKDDGTHRRRLTTNPFPDACCGDTDPNVSPDGRTVTFVRSKAEGELQALFAVNIDGTNERQLTAYRLEVAIKHDWAPDGRHIVITTNADRPKGRSPNVATIRANGSHLRKLTNYSGESKGAFAGSFSPNGQWIVCRFENVDRERFRLFKIRPDGTDRKLIAALPFAPRHIDWGAAPTELSR